MRSIMSRSLQAVVLISLCMPMAVNAAEPDPESIERHVARLLDLPDGTGVSAVQIKRNAYRLETDSKFLLNAFNVETRGETVPPQAVFNIVHEANGSWSFDANQSLRTKWWEKIDGEGLTSNLDVQHGVVTGFFDSLGESRVSLSLQDGTLKADNHGKTTEERWASWDIELSDSPGMRERSDSTLVERLNGYRRIFQNPLTKQIVNTVKAMDLSIRLSGANFAPLKNIAAFGERPDIPLAGDGMSYPESAVIGATHIDISVQAEGIGVVSQTGRRRWSLWIKSLRGQAAAAAPDETAFHSFTGAIDGMIYGTNASGGIFTALFPSSLTVEGAVKGVDSRLFYLIKNPVARVGENNKLNYYSYTYFPGRNLRFKDVNLRLTARDYHTTITGSIAVDLANLEKSDLDLILETKDIDRLITAYTKEAARSPAAGSLMFLLYFFKGAGHRTDDGGLRWTIKSKNGLSTINGTPFALSKILIPPLWDADLVSKQ
jgi:hypothetical protein